MTSSVATFSSRLWYSNWRLWFTISCVKDCLVKGFSSIIYPQGKGEFIANLARFPFRHCSFMPQLNKVFPRLIPKFTDLRKFLSATILLDLYSFDRLFCIRVRENPPTFVSIYFHGTTNPQTQQHLPELFAKDQTKLFGGQYGRSLTHYN